MACYPWIYFACHTRPVADLRGNRLLTSHQASVLDHPDELEPAGPLTLAAHMGVTASTMSLTIDRTARGSYVVRSQDPSVGWRVNLRLTKAGARIKSEKSVLDPERVGAVLEQLPPQERRAALRGLALLARASSEAMWNNQRQTRKVFRSSS